MSIISSRDNNTFVEFSDDDIMTLLMGDTFQMVPNAFGWYRHFLGGTDTFWVASLDYALAIQCYNVTANSYGLSLVPWSILTPTPPLSLSPIWETISCQCILHPLLILHGLACIGLGPPLDTALHSVQSPCTPSEDRIAQMAQLFIACHHWLVDQLRHAMMPRLRSSLRQRE